LEAGQRELRIYAPAKVNLILRVLDRRPDGYHNIWSVMENVGLVDELTLRLTPPPVDIRLQCSDPTLPTDGRNLVVRAASAVLERSGARHGLEIHLTKRIPVGAGLGGGSSNAAGTIAGLNALLSLGWTREEMSGVGATLGSDVPFFFFGPTAQVGGRGEQVSPLVLRGNRWAVLVHPGFPVETRWAYEELASRRTSARPLAEAHRRLAVRPVLSWEEIIPLMENDFEPALTATHAVFAELKKALLHAGAEAALLSGSGSTVFGLFGDETTARGAKKALEASGRAVYAVPTGAVPTVQPAMTERRPNARASHRVARATSALCFG
jgi:4-diphosphocytidyl-2-C-methyl-D-erythritol kinase